jgi:hypothetical protein
MREYRVETFNILKSLIGCLCLVWCHGMCSIPNQHGPALYIRGQRLLIDHREGFDQGGATDIELSSVRAHFGRFRTPHLPEKLQDPVREPLKFFYHIIYEALVATSGFELG